MGGGRWAVVNGERGPPLLFQAEAEMQVGESVRSVLIVWHWRTCRHNIYAGSNLEYKADSAPWEISIHASA